MGGEQIARYEEDKHFMPYTNHAAVSASQI